jgi:hypothetical protein
MRADDPDALGPLSAGQLRVNVADALAAGGELLRPRRIAGGAERVLDVAGGGLERAVAVQNVALAEDPGEHVDVPADVRFDGGEVGGGFAEHVRDFLGSMMSGFSNRL